MPLSEDELPFHPCLGVIDPLFEDLEQVQIRIEEFLSEVLPACRTHLKGLADGSIRKRNEKDLACSLCKYLGAFAHDHGVVFTFTNEPPDKSHKSRTNDMAVIPSVGVALLKVGPHFYDPEDHLYIIEAKLLPTPKGRTGQGDRTREYVVGDWESRTSPNKKSTGGVERFKEGWHGQGFTRSAMIAFLRDGKAEEWYPVVNSWIVDLIQEPLVSHKADWSNPDQLCSVEIASPKAGIHEFVSMHSRKEGAPPICLRHYWISCLN